MSGGQWVTTCGSALRLRRLPCGKAVPFRKAALLLQSRLFASFDAEADSLDLRFDSAHGKPEAFRTEGGKAANRKSDFLCKAYKAVSSEQ